MIALTIQAVCFVYQFSMVTRSWQNKEVREEPCTALNKDLFLSDALWGCFACWDMFLSYDTYANAGGEYNFLETTWVFLNLPLFPPSQIFPLKLQKSVIGKTSTCL